MKTVHLMGAAALILLVAVVLFPGLGGTTMTKLSLKQLTTEADTIVMGTVTRQVSAWNAQYTAIYTDVTLAVEEAIKGWGGAEVTLRIAGGIVGEIGMRTSNDPVFQDGERVIVFLNTADIPASIVGLHQGKYTVSDGMVTRDEQTATVAAFLDAIRASSHQADYGGGLGTGVLAQTTVFFIVSTGNITECHTRFSTAVDWYTGTGTPSSTQYDWWSVAAHEMGHCLGLGDAPDVTNRPPVMFPTIAPGEVRRSLTTDDIAGRTAIYASFLASGRVTTSLGAAISGVTMTFTRLSGLGVVPSPVQTQADGTWSQSGFEMKTTYRVTPRKAGCSSFSPTFRDFLSASANLNFIGTCSFTASGRVIDSAGGGISGVTMTFTRLSGVGGLPSPVQTDANGYWSQGGFDTNVTYRVTPTSKKGCSSFNPISRDFTSASSASLNFIGTCSFTASGRVTTSLGYAISGVTMTFTRLSGVGGLPSPVQTDANGYWSQDGFELRATYRVTPSKTGCSSFNPTSRDFTSGSSANLNFTGTCSFTASGRVKNGTGSGISGVTMTFTLLSGVGVVPSPVQTDANGNWSQGGFQTSALYLVTPSKTACSFFNPVSRSFNSSSSTNLWFVGPLHC